MGEESSVKLLGMWASPYAMRVKLALKIKGINFEYIEEDLVNKSEMLLKYNPVHKKVPILIHNGRSIAESLAILEYIDETWTNAPYLLPKNPYLRAKYRFWAAYFPTVFDQMRKILMTEGEAQNAVINELMEKLDLVEEGMKEIYSNGAPSFQDVKPGYLDIAFYSLFGGRHKALEEIFGVKIFNPERHPLLTSWITALEEVPEVKEVTPPIPRLVSMIEFLRPKYLKLTDLPTDFAAFIKS